MQPYLAYMINKTLFEDLNEARRITQRSKAFVVVKGELYKNSTSCRHGVTTYAMGMLELGPMCTRGFRGGKRTEKHDRERHTSYPGSGLS
jgi:hypothetical protein